MGLVAYLLAISGRTELPGGALVELLGEPGLSPAPARQLFARMFAADLLAHHTAVRAALAETDDPPPSAATLRRLAALTNQANLDLLRDPGLPPGLRPPDWPADALRVDLGALAARWLPPVRGYVDERVTAHGGDEAPGDGALPT
ncbi:hypothetical protein [Actinomycetospora aeridis]|uniref:Uncharacterized protein n=1 Tax=Actinomycetospora aeridis TaxID=3129231 RepID=A0ABU8NCJ1_9PSEU